MISGGTGSGIAEAGVARRGEYLKTNALSNSTSRTSESVSSKSPSLSPGNPTMMSVVTPISGFTRRSFSTKAARPEPGATRIAQMKEHFKSDVLGMDLHQLAAFYPGYEHPCDVLIDLAEDGTTVQTVRTLFSELRAGLVPLIEAIRARPEPNDRCLTGEFPEGAQRDFGAMVIRSFGYDFGRGRQDKTAHPFMIKLGRGDVRITTRYRTDNLSDGLFSALHEAGHALYEQGIDDALEGTPLYHGTTAGVHESQSRLWENLVGRSLPFWQRWYAPLKDAFPGALQGVDVDTFHRAINKVERSLIRTDADEVTYNLHVMLRFDFELAMLEGTLAVRDLPDAWRARIESDLGVTPPDDRDGVLQDVHWYGGIVGGAFQSYTLGNIMSAQFFAAARRDLGDLDAQIGAGELAPLRGWLTERIYRHGRKFTAPEIVERATGEPLSIAPYIAYLKTKYGALYGLS